MNGTSLDEWRSGTGKVIKVGDLVRHGAKSRLWRVLAITQRPSGNVDVAVTAHTPSARARDNGARFFRVDELSTARKAAARQG